MMFWKKWEPCESGTSAAAGTSVSTMNPDDEMSDHATGIPFVSSANGHSRLVEPHEVATTDFWYRNIRNSVQFAGAFDVVKTLCDVVVELSPHSVLRNYVNGVVPQPYIHCLRRGVDDAREFLKCVGTVFCKGAPVDWTGLGEATNWDVDVPQMPWNHEKKIRHGYFLHGKDLPGRPPPQGINLNRHISCGPANINRDLIAIKSYPSRD